jgi:hypothetical protein
MLPFLRVLFLIFFIVLSNFQFKETYHHCISSTVGFRFDFMASSHRIFASPPLVPNLSWPLRLELALRLG